jgi:methanogenic corrinoid protein MtbC1
MSVLSGQSHDGDDPARSGQLAGDCWGEMESLSSSGGHAAWASAAPQRPAVQERLTQLVRTIEHDIIPRLVKAHPQAQLRDVVAPVLLAGDVQRFTAHVMARDDSAIQGAIAGWRAQGVSVSTLFVDLLAPAARHLGELWEDDRCHFADVTVGLGRLQQIMRGLSSAYGTEIDPPVAGRRALLLPSPGDQHTFGLSMVAEFFARAGWEVVGMVDPVAATVQDKVKQEWFDLVGISAGSSARLEGVQACISAVKRHSHNRAVAVMVGGPLFSLSPELVALVGADGTASDAREAPHLAEAMIARRVKAG